MMFDSLLIPTFCLFDLTVANIMDPYDILHYMQKHLEALRAYI